MLRQSKLYSTMRELLTPLLAICFALLVSIIIIGLLGKSRFAFLAVLFQGAFGNKVNLINTLCKNHPSGLHRAECGIGLPCRSF